MLPQAASGTLFRRKLEADMVAAFGNSRSTRSLPNVRRSAGSTATGCELLLIQTTAALACLRASGTPEGHAMHHPVRSADHGSLEFKDLCPSLAAPIGLPCACIFKTHENLSVFLKEFTDFAVSRLDLPQTERAPSRTASCGGCHGDDHEGRGSD